MNCPAVIKLRATKTGDLLQIKQLVEKHENHEMSEVSVKSTFFVFFDFNGHLLTLSLSGGVRLFAIKP